MLCKLIVGSYNLRTPGSKDPFPNDWESRMPRINADITRMGYHIFGAQETIDFYTPHICRGNTFVSIGHGRCENSDGEACNIYYDKNKLEALSYETFWLSPTPERCSVVAGATYPRICTAGVFEEKTSRTALYHLYHAAGGGKKAGLPVSAYHADRAGAV